jgi:hypothetical protein
LSYIFNEVTIEISSKISTIPVCRQIDTDYSPLLHPHTLALKGIPHITFSLNIHAVNLVNFKNTQLDRLIIIIIIIIIMTAKVTPIKMGATVTISISFRKYLSNIPGKHKIKEQ